MEMVYQTYWHTRVHRRHTFQLTDGRVVKILNPGLLNTDAGPDFFNAAIEIEGEQWCGNVEMHVNASDWLLHGHHHDEAYNNVVLHVVANADRPIYINQSPIPTIELHIGQDFFQQYTSLHTPCPGHRCSPYISEIDTLRRTSWLDACYTARLRSKADRILSTLNHLSGNWSQTFLTLLARTLGFGLNADPFEILGRSIPLNYTRRHADNLLQLEAIFFGQAGMLGAIHKHPDNPYYITLCREYDFLSKKYNLLPPAGCAWKMARTRPANFPHRRMVLLATFCADIDNMLTRIIHAEANTSTLHQIFNVPLSPYWQSHFSFSSNDQDSAQPSHLSESSLNLIYINAVAPLYFAYGIACGKPSLTDAAHKLLHSLPAETNSIIRSWKNNGINPQSAADSQALLHLQRNYCDAQRCHLCRWGQKIFLSR